MHAMGLTAGPAPDVGEINTATDTLGQLASLIRSNRGTTLTGTVGDVKPKTNVATDVDTITFTVDRSVATTTPL
eukprot:COSAG02_NODE_13496_length_1386_cov_18.313908_3_plen_74_part_00